MLSFLKIQEAKLQYSVVKLIFILGKFFIFSSSHAFLCSSYWTQFRGSFKANFINFSMYIFCDFTHKNTSIYTHTHTHKHTYIYLVSQLSIKFFRGFIVQNIPNHSVYNHSLSSVLLRVWKEGILGRSHLDRSGLSGFIKRTVRHESYSMTEEWIKLTVTGMLI